jgi:glutaredoxin
MGNHGGPDRVLLGVLTVYGADWCGDCRRSKRLLTSLGVPFDWVDLEARPDQVEEVLRRNDGAQVIPVIVFPDGSHLTEPSDPDLRARLVATGLVET